MSDLDQLRVNLDEALRAISPASPAPVERVVRLGKGIRTRRRLTAFAGVVAVGVAVVGGYPALAHKAAAPAPPAPVTHRHTASMTDVPPGRDAVPGEIAEGTIYGKSWRISTARPGTHGMPPAPAGQHCYGVSGPAFSQDSQDGPLCLSAPGPDAASPVSFTGFALSDRTPVSVGRVRADVRYVTVKLSDGTRLRLIPVSVAGTRYVAFPVPTALTVAGASAYLASGQRLTAVPFNLPHTLVMFGMWQRAGQRVPARVTRTIATRPDRAWSAKVYAGPWGACVGDISHDDMICIPSSVPLDTQMLFATVTSPRAVFGTAANVVSYLRVTLTHGAPLRVRPVAVGQQKFFAFLLGSGQSVRHWTAYDAAGAVCASGGAPASHH
jgi:hypothetical protein